MKTITHKCDRCGMEGTDKELELWGLKVSYLIPAITHYRSWSDHKTVDWCRTCLVDTGVLQKAEAKAKEDAEKKIEPLTITDLIREICQEEIEASQ